MDPYPKHRPRPGLSAAMLLTSLAALSGGYGTPSFFDLNTGGARGPEPVPPCPPAFPKDDAVRLAAAEEKRRRKEARKAENARRTMEGRAKR